MENQDLDFKDILKHVDRESEHFVVRLETHHSGRQLTVIESHRPSKDEQLLENIFYKLKETMGTGGEVENGKIILHGDHREHVKKELVKLGFKDENVELI